MDLKDLAAVAFVALMALAGAVAGRLIWHHTHLETIKKNIPGYSFSTDWTMSVIVFVALVWGGTQLKFFAEAGHASKATAACCMLLAMVGLGWRPKWFWRW